MKMLYTANGRYIRCCTEEGTRPVIIVCEKEYEVDVQEFMLWSILNWRILREEAFEGEHTEFYQFSHGMQIIWSRGQQEFETLTLNGKALDQQKLYTIALSKFHYMNIQNFLNISLEEIKINAPPRVLATSYRDIVEEYMMMNPHLSSEVEGRLIVKT